MFQELTELKKPILDKDRILHWYVLLLYVEVMSSDFIEDFCGIDMFAAHLELISFLTQYYYTINVTRRQDFSVEQLPWDKENSYTRDSIELYYEDGSGAVYLRKKLLAISFNGKSLPILKVLVMTRQMQLNLLLTGSHQLMKRKPQVYVSVKRFSLCELQVATENFSNKNIYRPGGFDMFYNGWLANSLVVAVKRLEMSIVKDVNCSF
ncbi:hypothetical protein Tco_1223195 [Tanacetum coccineum]